MDMQIRMDFIWTGYGILILDEMDYGLDLDKDSDPFGPSGCIGKQVLYLIDWVAEIVIIIINWKIYWSLCCLDSKLMRHSTQKFHPWPVIKT